jgi:four helix bundle protein
MQNFKDLLIWLEAHRLTLKIYESSKGFPKEETFGITSQLRRAAVSIPCKYSRGLWSVYSQRFC